MFDNIHGFLFCLCEGKVEPKHQITAMLQVGVIPIKIFSSKEEITENCPNLLQQYPNTQSVVMGIKYTPYQE